jgi:Tat protein secretion system quality control protein TatD with DNase activity
VNRRPFPHSQLLLPPCNLPPPLPHPSQSQGVDAVVCFCPDWDRLPELQALVKGHPGFLYAAYGLHPDNVKR